MDVKVNSIDNSHTILLKSVPVKC